MSGIRGGGGIYEAQATLRPCKSFVRQRVNNRVYRAKQ
jgi:hypothetical protein